MLGRILPSKRLRLEAVTASDQANAAAAEIDEMEDPAAKEEATVKLLRSLSMGAEVDRLRMKAAGIDPVVAEGVMGKIHPDPIDQTSRDTAEKMGIRAPEKKEVQITPDVLNAFMKNADSKPLLYREFGEQADRYDGVDTQRLPEGERASLRQAMDHIGGVNEMPRRKPVEGIPEGLRNNSSADDFDLRPPQEPQPGGVEITQEEAGRIVDGEKRPGFWGAAKESALKLENQAIVGSLIQFDRIMEYGAAATRLQDMANYPLRERDPSYIRDRQLVVSSDNQDLLEALRAEKGGWRYIAGNVSGQMPGFVAEMAFTGGAYIKAGNAVRRLVLREMADQSFKQVAKRGLGRAVAAEGGKWLAGSMAQASAMPWRTASGTAERMLPRATHFGEDGGLVVDETGDEFGKALGKAYVDNAIEVSSEHAGDAIEWVLKSPFMLASKAFPSARRGRLVGRVLEKTRWTRRELSDLTNIAEGGGSSADMAMFRAALRQLPDGSFAGGADLMPPKLKAVVAKAAGDAAEGAAGRTGGREFMKAVSERAGFQPLGEYGEELLGDTARVGLGINDSEKSRVEQLKDVWAPGWEQFIGVNLGFAPMGLLALGGQSMAQVKSRHDFVRKKAERMEAWKKANGDSGEQSSRKWLDRYALAESPEEWQQLERAEFGEAREAFAANAKQSGAVKGAVDAVNAAENWQELESAWKQATAESLELRKKAGAADVREKGLGEELAKKFENAKTADDLRSAYDERFRSIRDRHAEAIEKAGRKSQADRIRAAKDQAGYHAALAENFAEDAKAGADEMVANGYLPVEVEGLATAKSKDEFSEKMEEARFMRARRELADSVEKAPNGGEERAKAIREIEMGDSETLLRSRMEAFRDFALPELLEKAGLPRELAAKTASATNYNELAMALGEAIGDEMKAPPSGLPSYLAESILSGDAELAVYFGTLRQLRLREWKEAIAGNVAKWAGAAPGAEGLLERLRVAGTEAEVSALVEEAETMRQEARKRGLAGAAVAVATDAAGAEDAAARIVEAMANGNLSAAEAIRKVSGTGGALPGIPADPMPPLEANPDWQLMARPDAAPFARAIVDRSAPAREKLELVNSVRVRFGLPALSAPAEAAFLEAAEAGLLVPRMVQQAIQAREEIRKDAAEAGRKKSEPAKPDMEAPMLDGPKETPEQRAERRGAEIVAIGESAEQTVERIERERAAGGLGPLEPSERGAAIRSIREGVFTADGAADLILGRKRSVQEPEAPKKKRKLFGIPVSERKPKTDDAKEPEKAKKDAGVELRTPQGNMRVKGRMVVVDLFGDVASSYDDDYEVKELQNRALDGLGIDDVEPRVEKIISEFDPRELMDSTTSESGPPVVKRLSGGGRLNVLSGNGRVKALRLMSKRKLTGKLAAYVKAVRAVAAERGITIPEGVKVPLLAIEMEDGHDLNKFVYLSNKDKIDGFNDYETALNDADVILREKLLEKFVPGDDGDILTEENRPFWSGFVSAVGGRKELYDSEDNPNDLLEPRIRRAILAALLKNRPNGRRLVQALIERGRNMGSKAQVTAIMAAAGPVLQVEAEKPGLSIANEFAAAIEMFLDYKANEGSGIRKKVDVARAVEKYLATPQLFHVERGVVEKALFRILANSPGVTAIRERFKAYAQSAALVDTTSGDLFGANDAATTAARDRAEKVRLLEQAIGVQVEEAEAAKPAKKSKPFMRSVSERKADAARKARPTVEMAREAARRLGMDIGDGAKVHFVSGVDDLPADLRKKLEADSNYGPNTKAFTMGDGSVWIFVPRHRDMADVLQSLLHEDLEAAMMPMMESPGFLEKLDRAFEAAGLTAAYAEELRNVVGQYDYVADVNVRRAVVRREKGWEDALHKHLAENAYSRREVMRELLAHVRQRRAADAADAKAKGMWEAIVEAIREFLSGAFGVEISKADMQKAVPAIEKLIDEISGEAKADAVGGGEARMRNEAGIESEEKRGLNAHMISEIYKDAAITPEQRLEYTGRLAKWFMDAQEEIGRGRSRSELMAKHGHKLEPVGKISPEYLHVFPGTGPTVFAGKGFFIDHVANHHANLISSEAEQMVDAMENPDEVRIDTGRGRKSLVFIRKLESGKYLAAVVGHKNGKDGDLYLHKSLMAENKKPYQLLRLARSSSAGAIKSQINTAGLTQRPAADTISALQNEKKLPSGSDGVKMRNEEDADIENVVEYEKQHGNILNADRAKLLFASDGYDPSSNESVIQFHKPAVALANRLFNRWLETKKQAGDGTVTFLGGGNGAGKSTIATAFSDSDFVVDSTMISTEAIRRKIQAVIDNGEIPKLVFVHRNPADAWRAIAYRAETGGHVVPKHVFLRTHSLARKAFLSLADEFNGKVVSDAVENSTDGQIRRMSMLELRALPDYGQEQVSKEIEHAEQSAENESREGDGERSGELEEGKRQLQGIQGEKVAAAREKDGTGQVVRAPLRSRWLQLPKEAAARGILTPEAIRQRSSSVKMRNEEDPALSAIPAKESAVDALRKEEARLAGKAAAHAENFKISMDRHVRLLKKIWPQRGKSIGVAEAQKAMRAELARIKKIPTPERKEVSWMIDSLANKEDAELRTAVFAILKELDAMSGIDTAISEAAFEMFSDANNAADVLEAMGEDADSEAAKEAAKKLRWAAPIYRKGVKAGWTASEKDSLFAFFHHREKIAERVAGKFGIDNRLLMDWKHLFEGMEAVQKAAKEETRQNRAKRTLKDVLGADGMERMGAMIERDPVEALRWALSAVRAFVFEKHAGKILDALSGPMLLSGTDVSYFVHNLETPSLEDMAFNRLHPSVKVEMRELLAELPWQAIFAQKALEHSEKLARELGGEYDGTKADRIAAVRAKQRQKILDWLETKEPIELISIQTRLNGLIQTSTNAQAFVLAGNAMQERQNAENINREVREALPEIDGQKVRRATTVPIFEIKGGMRGLFPKTEAFNSNPENLALILSAADMSSTTFKVLYSDIHEARDRAGAAFMRVIQAMDGWYADNGITESMRESWRVDVKEWNLSIQPSEMDAEPVIMRLKLTVAEMMDLAAHLMDDETLVDVARGARLGPARLKTTSGAPYLPSKSLAYAFRKEVLAALTPEQRKVAKRMVEMVGAMAPQVNAMSRMLEGRDIAYSGRHWSRRRDVGETDPDKPEVAKAARRRGLAESVHTKERTSNVRGLWLRDVFDHFDEQIKWAAAYSHFALVQKRAKRALSYRMDKRAKNEEESDSVLDLRDTLSRRIGEANVDSIEFAIDRLAGNRRLDEDMGKIARFFEQVARWDSIKTLGFRITSILNNGVGGSILLASEMGKFGFGGAGAYWTSRGRVTSPTALADKKVQAVKAAILEDSYFWNRIVHNRNAVQSQVIAEGSYDKARKKWSPRLEKFRAFSLSGMSLQELHNATAAVMALMKWKKMSMGDAIRWVQFATERTQNPSSALEETRSYVFFKRHGMSIFAKYWGQISVEANLLRRELIMARGASHRADIAKENATDARSKMDATGEKRWLEEEKKLRKEARVAARHFLQTSAAVAASAFYSSLQASILYYISRGVLPPVSDFLTRTVRNWILDTIGKYNPEVLELFWPQIEAAWDIYQRLKNDKPIAASRMTDVDLMGVDSVKRLFRSIDQIRSGDVVDGAIGLFGESGFIGGLPTGGVAQILKVARGIQKGMEEGWKTDIRTPVSKRGKDKK